MKGNRMNIKGYKRVTSPKQLAMSWLKCIAKTYTDDNGVRQFGTDVRQHSVAVGYVFTALLKKMHPSMRRYIPKKDGPVIAATHDVGKISPGFQFGKIQMKDLTGSGLCSDHSEVTEVALAAIFPQLSARIPPMSGAHHGRYHTGSHPSAVNGTYGGYPWQTERVSSVRDMEKVFGKMVTTKMSPLSIQLTLAMISISDWIASDTDYFKPFEVLTDDEVRIRANQVVDKMGWDGFVFRRAKNGNLLRFEDMFPYTANSVQKMLEKLVNGPAIYMVEHVAGGGKTEAAMSAAYKMLSRVRGRFRGLYFALPTRLTSNKIYERIEKWLKLVCMGVSPRLIHGQVSLSSVPGGGGMASNGSWFTTNRRAILELFGVGTIDQAVLAVMNVKYQYIRIAGLFRKVVILDEVHSYDAYTGGLVCGLVRQLEKMGCVIIILSATLTREAKARILRVKPSKLSRKGGYPKITIKKGRKVSEYNCGKVDQKIFDIRYQERSPDLEDKAIEAARNGAKVLWLENTVGESVVSYGRLKNKLGTGDIGLLHSRFLVDRRNQIENDWMNRLGPEVRNRPKGGCILVATQVLEQSVDVDFDILFTSICPSDFLLQRMGRIWRHPFNTINGKRLWMSHPIVYIMGPDLAVIRSEKTAREMIGMTARVYELFVLLRTAKIWSQMRTVEVPSRTRSILEATYAMPSRSSQWMRELYKNMDRRRKDKEKGALDAMSLHLPTSDDDEDDFVSPDECPLAPPATRKQEVPTRQIVICRKIEFIQYMTKPVMRLTLYDGNVVDIPNVGQDEFSFNDRKKFKGVSEKINRSMLKIVDPRVFDSWDKTAEPLSNVVWGNPVAVRLGWDGSLSQVSGHTTKHKYTDECGAVRFE